MSKYLNDWNDACVYAKECMPPFYYDVVRFITSDPMPFMMTALLVCMTIWWINEVIIKKDSNV